MFLRPPRSVLPNRNHGGNGGLVYVVIYIPLIWGCPYIQIVNDNISTRYCDIARRISIQHEFVTNICFEETPRVQSRPHLYLGGSVKGLGD
jgi:hypothetical protein